MYQRQVAVLIALITLLPLHLMKAETGETTGTPWVGDVGATRTTGELMDDQTLQDLTSGPVSKPARRRGRFPHRQHLANAPKSPVAAGWSDSTGVLRTSIPAAGPTKPHVAEFSSLATPPSPLNFTGATLPDCRSYPPDTMGAVGPSQFLVVLNGRIRVFDKKTGVKGSLDLDLDVFFQSVRSSNYTTDPRVRYDRMSGRWIIICITDASADNKVLLAVSNNGTITSSTVWTYFSFVQSAITPAGDKGDFADYPTLGVDANALYVGASIFTASGNFVGASAFVIRRSSVLGAGPIVVTAFRNLTGGDPYGAGPALPQGVDNYDPAATVGYFIGTDNASFGNLILRRVSNPGGTPTISGNINITVPSTAYPISVPHKGNNDLSNGVLDSIDDRLMAAHLRNGSLWTSHQIGVDNTGVSGHTQWSAVVSARESHRHAGRDAKRDFVRCHRQQRDDGPELLDGHDHGLRAGTRRTGLQFGGDKCLCQCGGSSTIRHRCTRYFAATGRLYRKHDCLQPARRHRGTAPLGRLFHDHGRSLG